MTLTQCYTFGDGEHVALLMPPCQPTAVLVEGVPEDVETFLADDIHADAETSRPTPLPVVVEGIPESMLAERRWVVWNYEWRNGKDGKPGKWTKVPYVATAPQQKADTSDPKTWRTFSEAVDAYEDGKCAGIGFVLGDGWVGFDADHTDAPEFVALLNTYTERSPSGHGVHAIARGTKPTGRCRTGSFELYDHGRYFTVTGHHVLGTPTTVEERTAAFAALHSRLFPTSDTPSPTPASPTVATSGNGYSDEVLIAKASKSKNGAKFTALWKGDTAGYRSHSEADAALCAMLAFWTNRDPARMDRLFRQSGLMREKWDSRRGESAYGADLIAQAIRMTTKGYTGLILNPVDPLPSAREFVSLHYTIDHILALRHQAGVFYAYEPEAGAYHERDELAVRSDLYKFLEAAMRWTEKETPQLVSFQPTKSKVENVLDALRAVCNLPMAQLPPCWLDQTRRLDPLDLLACPNGILHIPTRTLYPSTPQFFTLNGIDFPYDPQAAAPAAWLAFLSTLWPTDPESIRTVQEMFGYMLTPDTRFQKIGMLVGPKRSGKGITGRILRRLVGERNTCSPTLAAFGRDFGKQVLVGKTLAVISDARISRRTDTAMVAETLLSISGEDDQTVERKFLPDWNGKLAVRFLLLTNELPDVGDASGALASRFIVLALTESFYGKEDLGLFDRLVVELAGILNWALEGRDRLYARGYFVQPKSADDLIQHFSDLSSPEAMFLRENTVVEAGQTVSQSDLFAAWKNWCELNGRDKPGTAQTFGRNVRAALPWLTSRQLGPRGQQERYWEGLRLADFAADVSRGM